MFIQKNQYLNNGKIIIPISAFRLNTWCIMNKGMQEQEYASLIEIEQKP